jgi:hypothetical protein
MVSDLRSWVSVDSTGNSRGAPPGGGRVPLAIVESEFASVTVSLDTAGHSPRLHVRDNETGDDVLLSAIELASLCLATAQDRAGWLRVGLYRGEERGEGQRGEGQRGEALPGGRRSVAE